MLNEMDLSEIRDTLSKHSLSKEVSLFCRIMINSHPAGGIGRGFVVQGICSSQGCALLILIS